MQEFIIDGILGGILSSIISFLSYKYKKSNNFHKILGFVWAVPLTFFFLLYIVSKSNKKAMTDFTRHSLLGTILLVILSIFTLRIINLNKDVIILFAFLYSSFFTFIYFYLKIYIY